MLLGITKHYHVSKICIGQLCMFNSAVCFIFLTALAVHRLQAEIKKIQQASLIKNSRTEISFAVRSTILS